MLGLVYLIVVGTGLFKIGMSKRKSIERFKEYGTPEIICVNQVNDALAVERMLIQEFTEHFGPPVKGRETFKGKRQEIYNCFMKVINSVKFNKLTLSHDADKDRQHRFELELADQKTFNDNYCIVCGKSTLDKNGNPIPNVLLCGDGKSKGCDRDCHLTCAKLTSIPSLDWYCSKCDSYDNNHKKTCWSIANTIRNL